VLRPFSIEDDVITPTFKLKRPQLLKKYKKEVCVTLSPIVCVAHCLPLEVLAPGLVLFRLTHKQRLYMRVSTTACSILIKLAEQQQSRSYSEFRQ
jgi:hypothetical protein